jgi:hypothetical protein
MERQNINQLTDIDEFFVVDGTAAMYLATNPINNRTGVLKENGCMIGVCDDDIREKLASQIFNKCDVPCAEIDLFEDDEKNKYAFSYNVLKENEEHVLIKNDFYPTFDKEDKKKFFLDYINGIRNKLLLLPGISKKEIDKIMKRKLSIILMYCLIDNYDLKLENMKIIRNKNTGRFSAPIAYDFGAAFQQGIQKNGLYFYLTNEEVVQYLFKLFPNEIKTLALNIKENLTKEYVNLLFNQPYLDGVNIEDIKSDLLKRQNQISTEYDHLYEKSKISEKMTRMQLLKEYFFSMGKADKEEESFSVKK